MNMKTFLEKSQALCILTLVIGLMIYAVLLLITLAFSPDFLSSFQKFVWANVPSNVGIPCSALAAFGIVSVFWKLHEPKSDGENLGLEFFSLKFTGPSGPITLWVLCFLSFITAIWALK
jgi:hypothetical protein